MSNPDWIVNSQVQGPVRLSKPGEGVPGRRSGGCGRIGKMAAPQEIVPRLDVVEYITHMPGGSQSHLMKCSDGELYVVKLADNPQGTVILANEFLACRIAMLLELPVPRPAVINITRGLLNECPQLVFRLYKRKLDCEPGFAFGSRYQANVFGGGRDVIISPQDHLPASQFCLVENRDDFMGMLVFDKWTCNCDGRQVIYAAAKRPGTYHAHMIDNGYCFNGADWNFPDSPRRGLYFDREIYQQDLKLSSLEPWLARLEQVRITDLQECTDNLPAAWYGFDLTRLDRLLYQLDRRRKFIRELISATLNYARDENSVRRSLRNKSASRTQLRPPKLMGLAEQA